MKKTLKEILVPTAALTAVTLVVSAALVFTYNGTKVEQVGDLSTEALMAAQEVFPDSESFETADIEGLDERIRNVILPDKEDAVGFEIELKGYSKGLVLVIGINDDGTVRGYEVAESSETPGLGTQVSEEEFKSQFRGLPAEEIVAVKGKASAPNEIVAVSGASISSRAVVTGVNLAIESYDLVKSQTGEGASNE